MKRTVRRKWDSNQRLQVCLYQPQLPKAASNSEYTKMLHFARSLSHAHTLTHTRTLSLSRTRILSLSHTHARTRTHAHTQTHPTRAHECTHTHKHAQTQKEAAILTSELFFLIKDKVYTQRSLRLFCFITSMQDHRLLNMFTPKSLFSLIRW